MEKFEWIVCFKVDKEWIADGFNLTDEKANEMLANALPFAHYSQYSASIIQAPDADEIKAAQE